MKTSVSTKVNVGGKNVEDDCNCPVTSGNEKVPGIPAAEWHPQAVANRTGPSTAQHSKPTQQESKGALQKKKKKEFSAALCTHLGVNIGVKGPTAFELFMVYRTLGERGEKIGRRLGSGER